MKQQKQKQVKQPPIYCNKMKPEYSETQVFSYNDIPSKYLR